MHEPFELIIIELMKFAMDLQGIYGKTVPLDSITNYTLIL